MMSNVDEVHCLVCQKVLGTVTATEEANRPGFFRNVCDPNPLPTKCPVCKSRLTRVHTPQNLEG
jgi:hypothetical protein